MEKYIRNYTKLSLCGLNCGLCPMYHMNPETRCPGCGAPQHQSCRLKTCAAQHDGIQYCFECEEYPCAKYDGITNYDSFISHKNMFADFKKAQSMGLEAYQSELEKRIKILVELLDEYNDGRRKTLYCQAVNLLELRDIILVMNEIRVKTERTNTLKEKASIAAMLFQEMATEREISLKLNRKK